MMVTELLAHLKQSPLTEEHLHQIEEGLAHCEAGKHHIATAKRAGFDFPDELTALHKHETQLRQLKQVYFPGR